MVVVKTMSCTTWPQLLGKHTFYATHSPRLCCNRIMMAKLSHSRGLHSPTTIASLAKRIPPNTWDTHMHVVDPSIFPLDKAAQYRPSPHTIDQAQLFLGQLGITKMVIVQPSIYGNDNACTLDGLRKLGPGNGRAVIQFDPKSTSRAQLQDWHDLGVRGVRLNFKSVGVVPSAEDLKATLKEYAQAVGPLGWVLELYIALDNVPLLEQALEDLPGIKICVDHFGHPSAASLESAKQAKDIQGFASLIRLLQEGRTWVKLSASYRLAKDPGSAVVESLCKELVRARPDRCVFATDWPHTRFEQLDVGGYVEKILDWLEEENVNLEQVLVANAEELFDAKA